MGPFGLFLFLLNTILVAVDIGLHNYWLVPLNVAAMWLASTIEG